EGRQGGGDQQRDRGGDRPQQLPRETSPGNDGPDEVDGEHRCDDDRRERRVREVEEGPRNDLPGEGGSASAVPPAPAVHRLRLSAHQPWRYRPLTRQPLSPLELAAKHVE